MRRIIIIIAATALSSLSAFAQNTAKTLLNHEGSPIDIYQSVAPSGGGFRLVTTDKRHAVWTNGPLEVACSDLTAAALSSVGNAKIGCDIIGLALKSSIDGGAWAALGGGGSGDVTGPSSSVDNELTLFGSTSGKIIKSAGGTGIVFATSGVVSFLNSTGTGDVTRQNSPSIITPTIASFANATHDHSNAAGGGNIPEGSVMSLTGDLAAKAPLVSPSFTTPTLGVATTTSINKVSITAPAASATLTIANGATLTASATATVSGTNTGDQTSVSGNAGTATALAADPSDCSTPNFSRGINASGVAQCAQPAFSEVSGSVAASQMPALTGDATTTAGAVATTLATVNSNVGTFGSATAAPSVTLNGKGLATAASSVTITPAESSVTFTDITTNDATTSKHGYLLKLGGGTTNFLRADGTWAAPASSGANTALSNLASVAINTALLTGAGTTAAFTATAPTQTASSQAGTPATITASVAVAGSSNAGASSGGDVTITAGDAARLTSGNGNGGSVIAHPGAKIGSGVNGSLYVNIDGTAGNGAIRIGASPQANAYSRAGSGCWGFGASSQDQGEICDSLGLLFTTRANFIGFTGAATSGSGGDTGITRVAAGIVGASTGAGASTAAWLVDAGECYVTADQTNATATFASTTCSITVKTGRKYAGVCELFTTDSVAADGAKVDFNGGSATSTNFIAQVTAFDSALNLSTQLTSLSGAAAATTFTGAGAFEVHFAFEPSGNGTLIPRFAQNAHTTGTLTLSRGSHCTVRDTP